MGSCLSCRGLDEDGRHNIDSQHTQMNSNFTRSTSSLYPLVSEFEAGRQEIERSTLTSIWNGNFSVPIKESLLEGINVLDIGCGIGKWLIEMAEAFPKSTFVGIDILPIFPKNKPSNAEFFVHDALKPLQFEDSSFDFVTIRQLGLCFTTRQWEDIILKEVKRVLKQGGWLEWAEWDTILINPGPKAKQLFDALNASIRSLGLNPHLCREVLRIIKSTRFLFNVQCLKRTMPFGSWGGTNGRLVFQDVLEILCTMKKSNLEFMSITPQEYDMILVTLREEVETHKTYATTYRFTAQKYKRDENLSLY